MNWISISHQNSIRIDFQIINSLKSRKIVEKLWMEKRMRQYSFQHEMDEARARRWILFCIISFGAFLLRRRMCANLFLDFLRTRASPGTCLLNCTRFFSRSLVLFFMLLQFCLRLTLMITDWTAWSFTTIPFGILYWIKIHTHTFIQHHRTQRKWQMLRFFGCHKSLIRSKYRKRFPLIDSISSRKK